MTRSDLVDALVLKFPQLSHKDAEITVKIILDAMSTPSLKGTALRFAALAVLLSPAARRV